MTEKYMTIMTILIKIVFVILAGRVLENLHFGSMLVRIMNVRKYYLKGSKMQKGTIEFLTE